MLIPSRFSRLGKASVVSIVPDWLAVPTPFCGGGVYPAGVKIAGGYRDIRGFVWGGMGARGGGGK